MGLCSTDSDGRLTRQKGCVTDAGVNGISIEPQEYFAKVISTLETSEWGKSDTGKDDINVLKILNLDGKISFGSLPTTLEGRTSTTFYKSREDGSFLSADTVITISPTVSPERIPGVLAHEGDHAKSDKSGDMVYDFEDERSAYDARNAVDLEINPSGVEYWSDEEIVKYYGPMFDCVGDFE